MVPSPHFIQRGKKALRILSASLALSLQAVEAGGINWNDSAFQNNLVSTGSPMDDSFVFELGAFTLTDGFTPTSSNTDQWSSHWIPVQRNFYNTTTGLFSGAYEVASNASPFGTNQQGYIWGHNCSGQNGEWILFTNTTWKWPLVGGVNPAVSWAVSNSSTPIVGLKNGSGFQMKAASVGAKPLPPISPSEWRSLRFSVIDLQNPAVSGWNADPDQDGMSNLLEYATGRNPKAATRVWVPSPAWHSDGANQFLKLSVPKCAYAQATMIIEASGNLQSWVSGIYDVATLTNTSDLLEVRDLTATTAASRRFLRARVTIP